MIGSKCCFSAPPENSLRSRKKLPRMPGHTTSTLKMSTSVAPAASSCWASASFSVDEVGLVTTLALLPVLVAHSSAPALHVSKSLPTEPHDSVISTPPDGAGAAPGLAPDSVGLAGAASSADFFLQPPSRHSEMVSNTVQLFIDEALPVGAAGIGRGCCGDHPDYNLSVRFCNGPAQMPTPLNEGAVRRRRSRVYSPSSSRTRAHHWRPRPTATM